MAELIKVEVVYAGVSQQISRLLTVEKGSTVGDVLPLADLVGALRGSSDDALLSQSIEDWRVGIFSKPAVLDTVLNAGDRVEVYRPLTADPKQRRLKKAK